MRTLYTGLLITLIYSCQHQSGMHFNQAVGYAQGTTYQIKYLSPEPLNLKTDFDSIFLAIDHSMSTYQKNSLISRLNRGDSSVSLDAHFRKVLEKSLDIASQTRGYFDPTIGQLVDLWGFKDSVPRVQDSLTVKRMLTFVGYEKLKYQNGFLKIPAGVKLDFNAIAQGYTVDVLAGYLEAKGVVNYMVEVGGEVKAKGKNDDDKIWRIGIDKPLEKLDERDRFQAIIALDNASLATSGNYRKFWVDESSGVKYAHTIDPFTGYPAKNRLLSVSVIAGNCVDADAYATACMVMGMEEAWQFIRDHPSLEAYLIGSGDDGEWEVRTTEGFAAKLLN